MRQEMIPVFLVRQRKHEETDVSAELKRDRRDEVAREKERERGEKVPKGMQGK